MHEKVTNYEIFRQNCFQFINNTIGGSSTAMQIGAVTQPEMPLANDPQCWHCNDNAEENLYTFGCNCYNCFPFDFYLFYYSLLNYLDFHDFRDSRVDFFHDFNVFHNSHVEI